MNQHYFSLKNLICFTTVLITINTVIGIAPLDVFPNLPQSVQAQQNAESYYNRGVAKNNSGDFQGAIAECSQAVKLNPNDGKAYVCLGVAKLYLGDFQGAITECSQAIKLNPNDGSAYFVRAEAKSQLGDSQGADFDRSKIAEIMGKEFKKLKLID